MSIGILYVGFLIMGVVYALLSGAMGWLSDLVSGEVHGDVGGHGEIGHPHPISGTTVATFITGFGAGGIVAHYALGWSTTKGAMLATGTGMALALAAFLVLDWLFSQTQAGSEFRSESVVGRQAEVITAIPEGGMGEVSYVVKGQRETCSARASDGSAIAKGSTVVVENVVGSTFHVRVH